MLAELAGTIPSPATAPAAPAAPAVTPAAPAALAATLAAVPQAAAAQEASQGAVGCPTCLESPCACNTHQQGPAGQFPQRLWSILENPANRHLISWHTLHQQDDSFIIHDKDAFSERVLPTVFSHRNYPSFQRALSFHAFISHKEKQSSGKKKVVYYHPLWMRRDRGEIRHTFVKINLIVCVFLIQRLP